MTLTIKIRMDNAAFEPPAPEVASILRDLAHKLDNHGARPMTSAMDPLRIRDSNGNTVGELKVSGR